MIPGYAFLSWHLAAIDHARARARALGQQIEVWSGNQWVKRMAVGLEPSGTWRYVRLVDRTPRRRLLSALIPAPVYKPVLRVRWDPSPADRLSLELQQRPLATRPLRRGANLLDGRHW